MTRQIKHYRKSCNGKLFAAGKRFLTYPEKSGNIQYGRKSSVYITPKEELIKDVDEDKYGSIWINLKNEQTIFINTKEKVFREAKKLHF